MNVKRIYVKGMIRGKEFVGHMYKRDAVWKLDSHEEITKAEYRELRKQGIPSYGEHVTQCKRDGLQPMERYGWPDNK